MPSAVHIFTVQSQPATNFVNRNIPKCPIRVRINPRRVFRCDRCETRRWAANMRVQVYYDCTLFFCAACPPRGRRRRPRARV